MKDKVGDAVHICTVLQIKRFIFDKNKQDGCIVKVQSSFFVKNLTQGGKLLRVAFCPFLFCGKEEIANETVHTYSINAFTQKSIKAFYACYNAQAKCCYIAIYYLYTAIMQHEQHEPYNINRAHLHVRI